MTTQQPIEPNDAATHAGAGGLTEAGDPSGNAAHPHDFEVQKQKHQQIRNDPDYDDWEYGTEPLPHEAWVKGQGINPAVPSD